MTPGDGWPTATEIADFLRTQLAEAERCAAARERMAAAHELVLTPAEWQAAMALHPSTRGTPMPTPEEQRTTAARERRIAETSRREVTLYRAAIDVLAEEALGETLRGKLSRLLTATANALKGEPEPLHSHSWHDLPDVAAKAVTLRSQLVALVERWKAHTGSIMYSAEEASAFRVCAHELRALLDEADR